MGRWTKIRTCGPPQLTDSALSINLTCAHAFRLYNAVYFSSCRYLPAYCNCREVSHTWGPHIGWAPHRPGWLIDLRTNVAITQILHRGFTFTAESPFEAESFCLNHLYSSFQFCSGCIHQHILKERIPLDVASEIVGVNIIPTCKTWYFLYHAHGLPQALKVFHRWTCPSSSS